MPLNFAWTCPDIDDNIRIFKERIKDVLLNHIEEERLDDVVNDVYWYFEDKFENVRETNSDMREQATHQIKELVEERDNAISERDEFESDLKEANTALEEADIVIDDLKDELGELASSKLP